MRKVLEDDLARDLVQAIDITWDGRTTPFYHNVELEPELYVDIRGPSITLIDAPKIIPYP